MIGLMIATYYRPRQLSSLEPPIAPLGLDVYDSER